MHNQVALFLAKIHAHGKSFFIEAEGRVDDIDNFVAGYNCSHSEQIGLSSDGIRVLKDDANKWGLELRLYVPETPPESLIDIFTRNTVYRPEYTYRLNDKIITCTVLGTNPSTIAIEASVT